MQKNSQRIRLCDCAGTNKKDALPNCTTQTASISATTELHAAAYQIRNLGRDGHELLTDKFLRWMLMNLATNSATKENR
jgi:hypothetical protein